MRPDAATKQLRDDAFTTTSTVGPSFWTLLPETSICGGWVSSRKGERAGVGSTLPAGSIARTSNVCWPSASGAAVNGESHGANTALSSLHSNVEPGSVERNDQVGV